MVRRGNPGLFEQWLLARALASGQGHQIRRPTEVFAIAAGLGDGDAGIRTARRNWKILEQLNQVSVGRAGRRLEITLLDESGDGSRYKHPGRSGRYFKLPHAYWTSGFHERLSLPGKALLLIALYEDFDWFALAREHATRWYGLSESTIARGLAELRRHGVLEAQGYYKPALLEDGPGYTVMNRYCLLAPFGPKGRVRESTPEIFKLAPSRRTESPSHGDSEVATTPAAQSSVGA
ncbi:hypothetical protein [Patulibacter defluvii]|uniref:hypothetical protein n=1 Tax=Patulibacter defluvii TaxID=3095358 RepID=UPI002A749DD6|nr:hypothetical protein [Patulibacter sp. DM4]